MLVKLGPIFGGGGPSWQLLGPINSYPSFPSLNKFLSKHLDPLCVHWANIDFRGLKNPPDKIFVRCRLDSTSHVHVSLKSAFSLSFFLFFQPAFVNFFTVNSVSVHCLQTHKLHFLVTFLLKIGPTVLFTHLKIISLQYFQFQFSVSGQISSIQTFSWMFCPWFSPYCSLLLM